MTKSPTSTPQSLSPSPSQRYQLFASTSVVVVRLGDASSNAATAGAGVAQPVYIDEYYPGFSTPVSTLAIPTSLCTLSTGGSTTSPYIWHDTSGWVSVVVNESVPL